MSPTKPRSPCGQPRCPHLRPCPVHGKRPWEHDRPSAAARGYGPRWKKLREVILNRDGGLCVPCRAEDRITVATHVDHIVAKANGGTDDEANLRAICKRCHDSKSGKEGRAGR